MNIKNECLDIRVSCPYTGQPVTLRFVSESLYPRYFELYPEFFEEIKKTIKLDADIITNTK